MTFSVPADTFVTIEGDYWLRSKGGKNNFVHCDKTSKVPYCSPSLAVLPGQPDNEFYENDNALLIVKDAIVGWSCFQRTFRTQPGSSDVLVTLYLIQESSGPLSSSYFANLKIMSTRVKPVPAAISLPAEEPLVIDCNLDNWRVNNAIVECGLAHEGRDNVLEVSDDGSW